MTTTMENMEGALPNNGTTTLNGNKGEELEPPKKKAKHVAEKNPAKKDLAALPSSVLINIFKYLDLKSINNCAMLCSTLNNVSKNGSLYKKITLKYNMSNQFLESLVSKVSCLKELYVEYKFFDPHSEVEDCTEFNKYVVMILRKCGEYLSCLEIDSCRSDEVLQNLEECTNLNKLCLYRCKSNFQTLVTLKTLSNIKFMSCHFPQKIISEVIQSNANLQQIFLSDNLNINVNEICESISKYNKEITELHLSERKKLKSKSIRTLARLTNLKVLELISGTGFESDPDDCMEQVAAGCPKLQKLVVYGWKEMNDDNFIPALHMFSQLMELDLRGTNITIKSCREAALTLPLLKIMDVIKCRRVNKAQLAQLQRDFRDITIPLE